MERVRKDRGIINRQERFDIFNYNLLYSFHNPFFPFLLPPVHLPFSSFSLFRVPSVTSFIVLILLVVSSFLLIRIYIFFLLFLSSYYICPSYSSRLIQSSFFDITPLLFSTFFPVFLSISFFLLLSTSVLFFASCPNNSSFAINLLIYSCFTYASNFLSFALCSPLQFFTFLFPIASSMKLFSTYYAYSFLFTCVLPVTKAIALETLYH